MGWPEVILILIVLLVIFGAGKLPSIGTGIGGGIRELRQSAEGGGAKPDDAGTAARPADATATDAERRDPT